MEKENYINQQLDLLARDPKSLQWQQLSAATRQQTQHLVAQLLSKLFVLLVVPNHQQGVSSCSRR